MDLEERISQSLRRRASAVRPDVEAAWSGVEQRLRKTSSSGTMRRVGILSFALLLSSVALFGLWRSFSHEPSDRPGASESKDGLAVRATIDTGHDSVAVTAGAEGVWVVGVDSAACADLSGRAERIDPSINEVVQSIPLEFAPTHAVAGFGSVWVGGYACTPPETEGGEATFVATVARLDPIDGSIEATIGLPGPEVSGLAAGPTSVWVTWGDPTGSKGSLEEIDPDTNTVVQSVATNASVRDPVVGEGFVWVWQPSSSTILRIDPETAVVNDVPVDAAGPAVVGDGVIWIPTTAQLGSPGPTGPEAPAVVRLDPDANVVDGSPVATGDAFFHPFGAGDGSLWFLGGGDGTVTVTRLDEGTLTVTDTVQVANHGALEPTLDLSRSSVWVVDQSQGTVVRVGY